MSGIDGVVESEILLVTLTAPGDVEGDEWNEGASKRWSRFMVSLKGIFPGVSYWRVGEVQKRGLIHYHVVLRGLRWLPVEALRSLAVAAGFGSWVWVGRPQKRFGGVRGLCLGYLSKYMVKGAREWAFSQHIVTHAHDWRCTWRQRARRASGGEWRFCTCECDAYVALRDVLAGQGASLDDGDVAPVGPLARPSEEGP